jgi:hypothetical protein
MDKFEGESVETIVPAQLQNDERKIVLVTHDESCFEAHDGKRAYRRKVTETLFILKAVGDQLWYPSPCVNVMEPWKSRCLTNFLAGFHRCQESQVIRLNH